MDEIQTENQNTGNSSPLTGAPNSAATVNAVIPVLPNSVLSTTVYFVAGRGARSTKKGLLSFNGSNIMLGLEDGHVVFDEPLTNIKKVEFFSSLMRVVMPTGAASILFSDPANAMKDVEIAAATGYIGHTIPNAGARLGSDIVGIKRAQQAQDKLAAHADVIARWQQALSGKIKISGSANQDIGNSRFGVVAGMAIFIGIFSAILVASSLSVLFSAEHRKIGIVLTAIFSAICIFCYIVYKRTVNEKTTFPSSR
jgi:hypothetical protein